MKTVRLKKESFVYDRDGNPLQKMYECNEPGDQSGEYVRAEVARELEAEVARLKAQLAEVEMWKGISDRLKGKLAELREAVASVFEKRSNKDGDTKSHDDYVIAMANLKRLAGVE